MYLMFKCSLPLKYLLHLFIQYELMTFGIENSTFDFGFDLVHSFSKLLLEVEGLESLLVVVDAG